MIAIVEDTILAANTLLIGRLSAITTGRSMLRVDLVPHLLLVTLRLVTMTVLMTILSVGAILILLPLVITLLVLDMITLLAPPHLTLLVLPRLILHVGPLGTTLLAPLRPLIMMTILVARVLLLVPAIPLLPGLLTTRHPPPMAAVVAPCRHHLVGAMTAHLQLMVTRSAVLLVAVPLLITDVLRALLLAMECLRPLLVAARLLLLVIRLSRL